MADGAGGELFTGFQMVSVSMQKVKQGSKHVNIGKREREREKQHMCRQTQGGIKTDRQKEKRERKVCGL